MRIFIAGASGVVGRALTPLLISRGHAICGMFRNPANLPLVESLGAKPAIADALDMEAVLEAVLEYRPDAIISQLTALGGPMDLLHFDRYFAQTNKLRTRGNDNLLAAARTFGVGKFVAQSFGGWPYRPVGSWVKSETDSLNPSPPRQAAATLEAIRYLERKVSKASDLQAIALRYSGFYGPGTAIASNGAFVKSVKRRRFPLFSPGTATWSFVHVHDAATATAAAVESDRAGIYNVSDDEPAPVNVWLPALADILGARRPFRIPKCVGQTFLPGQMWSMMSEMRGCDNTKIKNDLAWQLRYPSWRQGFREGLG